MCRVLNRRKKSESLSVPSHKKAEPEFSGSALLCYRTPRIYPWALRELPLAHHVEVGGEEAQVEKVHRTIVVEIRAGVIVGITGIEIEGQLQNDQVEPVYAVVVVGVAGRQRDIGIQVIQREGVYLMVGGQMIIRLDVQGIPL